MSKIIYVLIAILIYMIINLFIVIKKNTKILHFAGSILFLQVFLLSVVNSHFITLSEYSVCEYIFLFCMRACGHFFRPLCLYSFYNLED